MRLEFPFVFHPPGDVTLTQWVIVLGSGFLLLALLVRRFVVPMLLRLLEERQSDIAGAEEQVARTLRGAEQVRDSYRERLQHIEDETEARMAEAIAEADRLRDGIVEEARAVAEDIVRRSHEEVAREQAKLMARLHIEFVDDVVLAAEHAAERSLDEGARRRLLAEFAANMRTASWPT
ncbi:MAG TPA: ATP synthase F0 subunit B [Chthonomonadales bacterium]|nr:ATP synthase F0 subunit B [Chthonomonadales bacterium]